ncbi:hypothetical protein JCM33374_g6434 [Metschnikowia sp. JCM 33374]|nr:hypothetical protein JCM33374_g6434 [Metschnikowia sp. JCM 33374]
MHEVVNFSCSHAAGHVITQLYNVQESHLPYTRNKTLTHSNDVFLVPTRVKGKTNYYPRSINVEFSGGFGALGKHEYREGKISPDAYNDVVIDRQERHVKNEYQLRLDAGKPTDASLLSTENTSHWTDYNKLIYRPESLVSLGGFNHPEGTHKNFPRLRFDDFNVGESEFKGVSEEIDDVFRKNLEQSDQIQGVSFFSECDSAWAGFTSEMMVFLRDEYFGNGVSSKYNLWTYGLMTPGDFSSTAGATSLKTHQLLTRIKAMTEFAANSTLFIPLVPPKTPQSFLSSHYDSSNLWHRGAVQSMFVNSLWGLNCQVQNGVSMATIENGLLRGNTNRNIVNEISLHPLIPEQKDSGFGIVSDVNIMDMYLNAGKVEANPAPPQDTHNSALNLGLTATSTDHLYAKGVICSKQPESGLSDLVTDTYVNPYMDEITKMDSFPGVIEANGFSAEFLQTSSLKPLLKEYRKIVERVRLPQHMEILSDKAEVIESLSSLMEEYTAGFSDESDYDD